MTLVFLREKAWIDVWDQTKFLCAQRKKLAESGAIAKARRSFASFPAAQSAHIRKLDLICNIFLRPTTTLTSLTQSPILRLFPFFHMLNHTYPER